MRRVVLLVSAFVGLLLAGCNSGPPTGTVTGTVKLNGKALKAGTVNFVGDKGSGSANIGSDGKYTTTDVPIGKAKVFVMVPLVGGAMLTDKGGAAPKSSATEIRIPEKYKSPEKSGLGLTVAAGTQEFNIDMK